MTTRSPGALEGIYTAIRASDQFDSMRRGGIVGDLAHRRRGGYHISCEDQPSSNYSRQAPADRRGRMDIARAIDISLNPSDMKRMTTRLMNACKANHANADAEPRIEPLREFFGTLDGRNVTGWNRYKTGRDIGYVTSDSSHLWHVHLSIFTDYADDPTKMAGIIDILLGVPLNQPLPKPDEGDDVTPADINAIAKAVLTAKVGTGTMDDWTVRHLIDWTARTTKTQGEAITKVLEKLVADDPGEAELKAELAKIREQLAVIDDEEEPDDPVEPQP